MALAISRATPEPIAPNRSAIIGSAIYATPIPMSAPPGQPDKFPFIAIDNGMSTAMNTPVPAPIIVAVLTTDPGSRFIARYLAITATAKNGRPANIHAMKPETSKPLTNAEIIPIPKRIGAKGGYFCLSIPILM
jgi:hypothetical protein